MLEAAVSKSSAFLTLTYSDYFLPSGETLIPKHLTDYLKRLRKSYPEKIRYFAVGEYGEISQRPHYHLCLFGIGYEMAGYIQEKWDQGLSHVGEVNQNSANYITGYCTKKLDKHHKDLNGRHPEFMRCSKMNGGLGLNAMYELGPAIEKERQINPTIGVVRQIQRGRKKLPLGRYLTKKLAEISKTPTELFAQEFYDYQSNIFSEYLDDQGKFMINYQNATEGKRNRQERTSKIFSQKRNL